MDDSAPKVVPPTPPVAGVPPFVVGMPLIERDAEGDRFHVPRKACEAAGREGARLMGSFFGYHAGRELMVRRLVLATPGRRGSGGAGAKRKGAPSTASGDGGGGGGANGHARRNRSEEVPTCGATFGCTLGIIVTYLEGRGIPAERAHVLRSLRSQLVPAADALRTMAGEDADGLALGMASCRVVHAQRAAMAETAPRIDHKYGHVGTAVGATATLLAVFGVMAEVPDHCRHFADDCSLGKALRCAEAALESWKPAALHLPEEHWAALGAERRALRRARLAVCEAVDHHADLAPPAALQAQLAWARAAAFPSGELVNEFTQTRLCERIRQRALFARAAPPRVPAPRVPQPGVLPLAEIPAAALAPARGGEGGGGEGAAAREDSDTQSCASSSWRTLSSCGSNFSHVSHDSLGGLVESFVAGTAVL